MARVNIIIRAFNRLEYTVTTVRDIDRLVGYDNYKIIVVDNASTDGTKEWLKSLVVEGYYKLKPIYLNYNAGDFGGTKIGYDNLDSDCEYTMQWDNDCPPLTEGFLAKMVDIMDTFPIIGQLMLKREGVGTKLEIYNKQEHNAIVFGDVNQATCVNMHRRTAVQKINFWITEPDTKIYWDFMLNNKMREAGYCIKKIENIKVQHIDCDGTWEGNRQLLKYPTYTKNRTKNINYNNTDYTK